MSKYVFNSTNKKESEKGTKLFHLAIVVSNEDDNDGGRIKVRIKGFDNHIDNVNDLPYVFPMLQKFFHVIPKVGESVWVMFPDSQNPYTNRVYFGPIISQPQTLDRDDHLVSSMTNLDSSITSPKVAPSKIPESKGVYPDKEDVALQGRNNNDIIFKDNEIVIRNGKFTKEKIKGVPKFNKKTPSYIQLKNNSERGVINVVSNKIHLLTHKDGQPLFNLTDQKDLISEEELNKIISEAHSLVFGDLLIEYLNLFKDAFINHVHAYNGTKTENLKGEDTINKFLEYDVNNLLSKNIKIN